MVFAAGIQDLCQSRRCSTTYLLKLNALLLLIQECYSCKERPHFTHGGATNVKKAALQPEFPAEEVEEDVAPVAPSPIAAEIAELQSSIKRAMGKRERLPQPMFWSLFHSRIKDIRKRRELKRVLSQFLDG